MKTIWKQCWDEFSAWFISEWKYAWDLLSASIIGLVQACFEWLKTIVGGAIAGAYSAPNNTFTKSLDTINNPTAAGMLKIPRILIPLSTNL